jgi:methylthioribulose-1-phosphate dehydratase
MTDVLSPTETTRFSPADDERAPAAGRPERRRRPRAPRAVALDLASVGRRFHARGWVLGTSGNLSVVTAESPLRLAISASSVHKGRMRPEHILEVDERGDPVTPGSARPSAETRLHIEIARRRRARAVLHTHSVWGTMLSDAHAAQGGLTIEGYEMLKGLRAVTTHQHREWIPIVENDQDMRRLSDRIAVALDAAPDAHALLLHRHGLYTWGESLDEAERHVEILEFLFETIGRTATYHDARRLHGTAPHP